jgi:L-threonylcarbamoyladenylate synthase
LIQAAKVPLAAPSANRSNLLSPTRAEHVLKGLASRIDLVLDGGPAHGGQASTVVDCTGERPVMVRAGAIPADRIAAVLDAAGVGHDLAGE